MEPGRIFARADAPVVVEQAARWRTADGQLGDAQAAASVFCTEDERVSSVIRYPDLAAALQAAGLDESDEQPSP
jgi:hypothetical protein